MPFHTHYSGQNLSVTLNAMRTLAGVRVGTATAQSRSVVTTKAGHTHCIRSLLVSAHIIRSLHLCPEKHQIRVFIPTLIVTAKTGNDPHVL